MRRRTVRDYTGVHGNRGLTHRGLRMAVLCYDECARRQTAGGITGCYAVGGSPLAVIYSFRGFWESDSSGMDALESLRRLRWNFAAVMRSNLLPEHLLSLDNFHCRALSGFRAVLGDTLAVDTVYI